MGEEGRVRTGGRCGRLGEVDRVVLGEGGPVGRDANDARERPEVLGECRVVFAWGNSELAQSLDGERRAKVALSARADKRVGRLGGHAPVERV